MSDPKFAVAYRTDEAEFQSKPQMGRQVVLKWFSDDEKGHADAGSQHQ